MIRDRAWPPLLLTVKAPSAAPREADPVKICGGDSRRDVVVYGQHEVDVLRHDTRHKTSLTQDQSQRASLWTGLGNRRLNLSSLVVAPWIMFLLIRLCWLPGSIAATRVTGSIQLHRSVKRSTGEVRILQRTACALDREGIRRFSSGAVAG